jgi:invasion protein IalB
VQNSAKLETARISRQRHHRELTASREARTRVRVAALSQKQLSATPSTNIAAGLHGRKLWLERAIAQQSTVNTTGLPGGASSLREAHEDWVVGCAMQEQGQNKPPVKVCSLSQEQFDQRTRQRVLAVELRPGKTARDVTKATFILPFGLDLQKGVTLSLDESAPIGVHQIRTCLPAGCLLDVDLDAAALASFNKAKLLKLNATADGGQQTSFSISLKGFPGAFARAVELAK